MFCSVITKNSNWEILTKNLVTFRGRGTYKRGGGAWTVCRFKGGLENKGEVVFLRGERGGWASGAHYENYETFRELYKKLFYVTVGSLYFYFRIHVSIIIQMSVVVLGEDESQNLKIQNGRCLFTYTNFWVKSRFIW